MKIHLHDEFPPETIAMMQALYSRSPKSVADHAARVRETGADAFMESYYVGYGHASIGDCGTTTLFAEGVSLLACKALQDNALYNGQETSTRYIDFASQPLIDPVGEPRSAAIQKRWMDFYAEAGPLVEAALRERHPRGEGESDAAWRKAIAARRFDVMRAFLPAGVVSQASWSTNLHQAHDHTLRLMTHPLAEVRELGAGLRAALNERYPSSFSHRLREDELLYLRQIAARETYFLPARAPRPGTFEWSSSIDRLRLEADAGELLATRPRRSRLPKSLRRFGSYRCRFLLDFGSFRDLQRHRGGFCRMPLLTHKYGFESWYLDQLPEPVAARAKTLVAEQFAALDELYRDGALTENLQYLCPLGARVACEIDYDLPQMVYVAELRSQQTVHATLRAVAHAMLAVLRTEHPRAALYGDCSDSALSIRRGEQDIVERNPE